MENVIWKFDTRLCTCGCENTKVTLDITVNGAPKFYTELTVEEATRVSADFSRAACSIDQGRVLAEVQRMISERVAAAEPKGAVH